MRKDEGEMRKDEGAGRELLLTKEEFLVLSIIICIAPYLMAGLFMGMTTYSFLGILPFVIALVLTYRTWKLCP